MTRSNGQEQESALPPPVPLYPNDCRYCSSRNFLKSGVDEKSFAVKATKWVVHRRAGGHCSPSFRLISRPLLYRPDIRIQKRKKKPLAVWRSAASGISFPSPDLPFFVEKLISYDSLTLLIDKEFRNNDGICAPLWMYIEYNRFYVELKWIFVRLNDNYLILIHSWKLALLSK